MNRDLRLDNEDLFKDFVLIRPILLCHTAIRVWKLRNRPKWWANIFGFALSLWLIWFHHKCVNWTIYSFVSVRLFNCRAEKSEEENERALPIVTCLFFFFIRNNLKSTAPAYIVCIRLCKRFDIPFNLSTILFACYKCFHWAQLLYTICSVFPWVCIWTYTHACFLNCKF